MKPYGVCNMDHFGLGLFLKFAVKQTKCDFQISCKWTPILQHLLILHNSDLAKHILGCSQVAYQ